MIGHPARLLATFLLAFGLACGAHAQKSGGSLPRGDVGFMKKAAADGIAEVELGRLAQQKAARDEVKQFATRMVEDHSRANEDLRKVAAARGIELPAKMDPRHQKAMDRLQKRVGPEFDRDYMKAMVKDHRKDVDEFREHSKSRKPNDVTRFAAATLPTLKSHLQAAEATYDVVMASRRSGDRETGSTKK